MSNRIQVNVISGITNVVQVNTLGPKGEAGETGATGAAADPNAISGSLNLTGSLIVSSSYVDFTNATSITGSTFSGSLFIGSFQGNGSGLTAITASAQPSGPNTSVQFRDTTDNSGSSDFTFNKESGGVFIGGALTASGNISSSGTVFANSNTGYYLNNTANVLYGTPTTKLIIGDEVSNWPQIDIGRLGTSTQKIMLSGQVSASGDILLYGEQSEIKAVSGSFSYLRGHSPLTIDAKVVLQGSITASAGALTLGDVEFNEQLTKNIKRGFSSTSDSVDDEGLADGIAKIDRIFSVNITASGDISSSGTVTANAFVGGGSGLTSLPSGTLSSSAQIGTEISGAFTAVSGGFSTRVTTLETTPGGIFNATGSIQSTTNDLQITGSLTLGHSGNSILTIIDNTGGEQHVLQGRGNTHSYLSMGSLQNIGIGTSTPLEKLTVEGNISSSGAISTQSHITASGNISSSGTVYAQQLNSDGRIHTNGSTTINNTGLVTFFGVASNTTEINGTNIHLDAPVTASGNISSSGNIYGRDGIFTRDNLATVEIIGINSIGGVVGTDTDHDLVFRRNNIEGFRLGNGNHITASGNISSSGNLIGLDLNLFGGDIDLKNAGAQSNVKFYCESSNAHYTKLQAALHADYGGNPTTTLPAYDFNFKAPNFNANVTASGNISSSGTITAAEFVGGGAGLTGLSAGIFNTTGSVESTTNNLRITGSVFIDDVTTNSGSADANSVFKVRGTLGNLLTVTNDMSDDLLNIKDISGVTLFKVSGSGDIVMKDLPTTEPTISGSLWISGSSVAHPSSGYLMIFGRG